MDVSATTTVIEQPVLGEGWGLRARCAAGLSALAAFLSGAHFQASCVSAAVHSITLVAVALVMLDGDPVAHDEPVLEVQLAIDEVRPPEPEVVMTTLAAESVAAGTGGTSLAPGIVGTGTGIAAESDLPTLEVALAGIGGRGQGGHEGMALSGNGLLKEVQEVKQQAAFFGVSATGRKFAFVVDTSGSMAQDDRWIRARAELVRSLQELGYGQEYYVAFFNHTPFPMPQGKLVPSRGSNVASTVNWIHRAVPAGGTEPWPALQLALNLKPDAVFLLTDGLFDPAVVENVRRLRGSLRVPIHTIGFAINNVPLQVQTQIEEQLNVIARSTGGTYRFVP
ncbi:MAG: VWA domain-containing protein [Planctomycetaceae bacterium]|nr:VWA domain-containing protein [Planctomycetaceae bacterium]